jgi:hypothetical protein
VHTVRIGSGKKSKEIKMTNFVAYHSKTTDIALFQTNGFFWIGSYGPFLTHQNDEPRYVWISGNYSSAEEGLKVLQNMTGNEF